ncbi:glycosyl transferase [Pseudomonas moraviensis]|uniref:Glycosyl transferase n=1 Tax=Pseudomonas moraviensis TaxID=321662 RepID=A0A2A2PQU7_9PSED|nr:glycosyltransferase [Pseudomonas moraviensis]PAW51927.1 glycosyl transferase [Pseudomonas moraviensis]PAW57948.1 glycosyl transferase [Pseudomonas moraviensis]
MPVKHPKIAVLLAAYNGMQWIEEQISSILAQTGVDISLFISVDPSSDGTRAWCETYAAGHPQVVLLPEAGTFGGASRNFFRLIRDVDLDSYDFIAFADQDDIWFLDKLSRAAASIQDRQVDAYSSNVTAFWPDGKHSILNKAQNQVTWDYLFEAAGPGCTYVLSNGLARALKESMLHNWQSLQDVSLHDWYCYAFARRNGYRWYIDPEPSMNYRQHASNQVGANKGLMPLIARYKTIHDGWWFQQVQLICRLLKLEGTEFVSSWLDLRPNQLMRLSLSSWKCRRRMRDKVLFFCLCWVAAVMGVK